MNILTSNLKIIIVGGGERKNNKISIKWRKSNHTFFKVVWSGSSSTKIGLMIALSNMYETPPVNKKGRLATKFFSLKIAKGLTNPFGVTPKILNQINL